MGIKQAETLHDMTVSCGAVVRRISTGPVGEALISPASASDFTQLWGALKALQLAFVAFPAVVLIPEKECINQLSWP